MTLAGATTGRLPAAELAIDPRLMHVVAWFDGNARGGNPNAKPYAYPRRLTPSEARSWREGWRDGRRERACHTWHGFTPCTTNHPPYALAPPDHDAYAYAMGPTP